MTKNLVMNALDVVVAVVEVQTLNQHGYIRCLMDDDVDKSF